MADDVDFACQLADAEREASAARVQAELRARGTRVCIACGEPIDPVRRAVVPFARRCIDCAAADERMRRLARQPGAGLIGHQVRDLVRFASAGGRRGVA